MKSCRQKELIKLFVRNILNNNNSTGKDSERSVEKTEYNNSAKELYKKILKESKYRPVLNELINDYFSAVRKHNNNIELELPYIIQILALVNNSIDSVTPQKL